MGLLILEQLAVATETASHKTTDPRHSQGALSTGNERRALARFLRTGRIARHRSSFKRRVHKRPVCLRGLGHETTRRIGCSRHPPVEKSKGTKTLDASGLHPGHRSNFPSSSSAPGIGPASLVAAERCVVQASSGNSWGGTARAIARCGDRRRFRPTSPRHSNASSKGPAGNSHRARALGCRPSAPETGPDRANRMARGRARIGCSGLGGRIISMASMTPPDSIAH
jgi:hypothetical protein